MVELCRVDDRMLHGQVAVTWVNQVAPDAILIANDEAATNEMSKLAFKMAKPAGVKLAIRPAWFIICCTVSILSPKQ